MASRLDVRRGRARQVAGTVGVVVGLGEDQDIAVHALVCPAAREGAGGEHTGGAGDVTVDGAQEAGHV